ncbi:structural protein [Anaeromassilibacillus senegalensis]|uniref:hypothetical protein n=1 Tax=Anaeromassilibacillus senegalensis TaxID=1673717 RepID=UPI0006815EFE|nr:hypothetical protein [Anaeromassilibacillus senegalensis]
MGLFGFFKKRRAEKTMTYGGTTFQAPEPISNEEYQHKRQKEIDFLERKYDLSTVEGIMAIPVPKRKEQPTRGIPSVTGKIEYYLMIKGGQYEKDGQVELALACYRKANQLMPMSSTIYSYESYVRLPRYLRKLRRFEEARIEEAEIDALFGEKKHQVIEEQGWLERRNRKLFFDMRELGTDLVEATYIRCCCAECAQYRERVYSLSGQDRRFPKLPDALLYGNHDCGILLFPFIDGVSSMQTRDGKDLHGQRIIKYSNRPFIDDRTPDELRDMEEIRQKQTDDAIRERSRTDYNWLWEFMPELCPKSFSAYRRMQKAQTENFKKIVIEAKKHGRNIE